MTTNPTPDWRPIDAVVPGRREAIVGAVCLGCDGPATEFADDLSRREYGLSGLCQPCQDRVFNPDPDRCAWCGGEADETRGPIEPRSNDEYEHGLCWLMDLADFTEAWPADEPLRATSIPWSVHPEEAPPDERHHGVRTRWHVAYEVPGTHECVAVFGRRSDALAAVAMVGAIAEREPTDVPPDLTPFPWRIKREQQAGLPDAWHLYSEAAGGHVCVATAHRLADALGIAAVSWLVASELAQKGGQSARE